MISNKDFQKLKYETLKHFWGHNHFRDPQEEIIDSILSGNDTLVLLPTGGGKSLCYQLPALFQEGTCIVVSPLLALMKDQVVQLKNMGIEAEYLSSELDDLQAENIFTLCKDGIIKILYISPERLTNSYFLSQLEEIQISFIAVDEAHCISEWGQDFRPSYQNISDFRKRYTKTACIALTATATPKVLSEIQKKLGLVSPKIFQKSFKRNNISIIVHEVSDKYQRVYDLLRHNQKSGIIYTATRKDAENLTYFLKNKGLSQVDFYHAGLAPKERHLKQKRWVESGSQVLVSTNAFGMGIDKDDVHFVIHLSPPGSIENYYQEIGRAGRNGAESHAIMLWNEQELSNFQQTLFNQIPNKKEFVAIVSFLYSIFQVADNDLPEAVFQLEKQRIQHFTKTSAAKVSNVLTFLHNQELIFYNNTKSLSSIELKMLPSELDLLPKKDSYFIEDLLRNLMGFTSGKVMFSEIGLSKKMNVDPLLLKERIKDMAAKNYLEYIDGALASIKFLKHRQDRLISSKYWSLFEQIQTNKIRKWEEMKFFIRENDFCKMKLILSYFGEKDAQNCGKCYICESKKNTFLQNGISGKILAALSNSPATIYDLSAQLHLYRKDEILENLILLLDSGKVKMRDFRTYTLA